MDFMRANGGVIHFADEGPRGAPTIVFSNSLGTDLRIWDAVAGPLAEKARVVRYDTRGHGLSEIRAGAATMNELAGDVAALLDRLDVREATIVGLSIGGMIAQALYRLRPDLVRSLALCDTAARIGTVESWTKRIEAIDAGGLDAIADGVVRGWFTRGYQDAHADAVAGWRAMLARTPQAGYVAACAALRDADLTADAGAIRAPTLCVVGEHDPSTPVALVRQLAELIPAARFQIIAGAAHIPCVERPAALLGLIEAHLEEVSP